MRKVINIGGKDTAFVATASTVRRYRDRFGSDLLSDFDKLDKAYDKKKKGNDTPMTAEALTIFENLAYIMAKQADPSVPEDPDDWLDMFDVFPVDVVFPQIIKLWSQSMGTTAELKKTAVGA